MFVLFTAILSIANSLAQNLPELAPQNQIVETLTTKNIDEVAKVLHSSVPSPNLQCLIKIKHLRELRKFSFGEKYVEMLEVNYTNSSEYDGIPVKMYFPVGSILKRSLIVSQFAGQVEQIELESSDRLRHILTFQHDGNGHFIWGNVDNIYSQNPCRLK